MQSRGKLEEAFWDWNMEEGERDGVVEGDGGVFKVPYRKRNMSLSRKRKNK